jgi:hypothetical protein
LSALRGRVSSLELPASVLGVTKLCGFGQLVLTTAARALLGVPARLAAVTLDNENTNPRVSRTTC